MVMTAQATASRGSPALQNHLLHRISAGVFFGWTLLMLLPVVPVIGPDPRERSWSFLLHEAFLWRLDFGRDFVFTYGPLGFITGDFHPATYLLALGTWTLILAAYAASLWHLTARSSDSSVIATALLFLIVAFTAYWPPATVLLLLPGIIYFVIRDPEAPALLRHSLAVALALVALTKFSVFSLVFVAIGAAAAEKLSRRSFPVEIVTFATALAAFWVVTGQALTSFVPYVRNSLELSAGYADAMQIPPPRFHDPLLPFVLSSLLFWVGSSALEMRRDRLRGLVFAAATAAMHLINLKGAFVRPDRTHTTAGYLVLALMQVAYWGSIRGELQWRTVYRTVAQVLAAAGLAVALAICFDFPSGGGVGVLLDQPSIAYERARVAMQFSTDRSEAKASFDAWMARMRESYPLRRIHGGADAMPSLQPVLIAHGVTLAMRPVFESYVAYTPGLQRLNVQRLRGSKAARTILFDVWPADDRFPASEDGASWPDLASRYDVTGTSGRFLVLERRARPRQTSMRLLTRIAGRIGEPVRIPPATGPVFMSAGVTRSAGGAVRNAVYRSEPLRITAVTASGTKSWRLVAGCAESGFVVSPLIENREDFAAFVRGWSGRPVISIAVDTADASGRRDWDREIRFAFYEMSDVAPSR